MYTRMYIFMENEYNKGALEDSLDKSEAFTIISDESNNPAGQDRKILNFDVEFIPTETAETINIRLKRDDNSILAKTV